MATAGERGADSLLQLFDDATAEDVDASPLIVGSAVEAMGEAAIAPTVELSVHCAAQSAVAPVTSRPALTRLRVLIHRVDALALTMTYAHKFPPVP